MSVLTLEQAEDLAERTLAAIDAQEASDDHYSLGSLPHGEPLYTADRERVASDLEGLRECHHRNGDEWFGVRDGHRAHARRYIDGLLRTARLYGIEP